MALSPNFNQVNVDLKGIPLNNPTSLQFGPDGRLYISQQDGLIRSFNLKTQLNNDGSIQGFVINNVGGFDSTDLVKNIPNHNDDGSLSTQNNRQVTGLVTTEGPNGEVVLYVSSSDPRIGGGPSGEELDLDTNSGIISRLTKQLDGTWEKVDLVIGLPRSEENHSINGLDIRTEIVNGEPRQIMYAVSGGNTNRGAPSNNFAWISEYYYAAAVLRIDLTQLEEMEATEGLKGGTPYVDPYVYALPTLNDPTRPDDAEGRDISVGTTGPEDAEAGDTFGGNDGRNQAKYDPDGPVQIYSMGYRNAYDIVITENNHIYTFDNGPNNGWGDIPLEADGSTPITHSSQIGTNHPNVDVNTGNDTDPDNLHLVTEGFYAGHPNPVYASGAAAGLYTVKIINGSPVVIELTDPSDPNNDPTTTEDDLPVDWNEIAGGFSHPEASVYLTPGSNPFGDNKGPDDSLVTIKSSSNGLTEYAAGKATGIAPITDVVGAEVLAVVAFNGNVYFMEIVGDGTQAGTNVTDISPVLVGGTPLDVRDVDDFAIGTEEFRSAIFIAQFATDSITALVPGIPPATNIDKDNDGLEDNIDPLQYDPVNGINTLLNNGETLLWDFNPADSGIHPGPSGEYNIGMTGWMINNAGYLEENGEPPELFSDPALTDLDNTIRGGAPGIVQVKSVGSGNLEGTGNNQKDAIQTGFLPAANVDKFTIKVPIFNPFSSDANDGVTFTESASMGFSLGDGTMSNWIGLTVAADETTGSQVKLTYEENDVLVTSVSMSAPELLNAVDDDLVELFLTVDMDTSEVIPSWRYQNQGVWSPISQLGSTPVQLDSQGAIVAALQGQNSINGLQSAPIVTLISTSQNAQPFTADFTDLTIGTPHLVIQESAGQTQVREGQPSAFDTYSLALSTQPTSDVTVTLSPDAQVSLDKTDLVFTPTNWAEPQQVTITAIDDILQEGNHTSQISHQITTTDQDYAILNAPELTVDVFDNDVPEVLVQSNELTEVAEGGYTDTYTLVLTTQPTSNVTVILSPDTQITLDQTQVVFTPTDWDQPQTVTITAVDDDNFEDNHTGRITHTIDTNDGDYAQVTVPDVTVNVVDNDEPSVLYRINVGGAELASADGSAPVWSEDTNTNPSPYRVGTGGANAFQTSDAIDVSNPSLPPASALESLFQSERWDPAAGADMQWEFPVAPGSNVEVRLYLAEIYKALLDPGQRVFDVAVEGVVPNAFDNIDPIATAGYDAFMLSHTVTVTDGILDLDFLHGVENPALKGIEILSSQVLEEFTPTITTANSVTVAENQTVVIDVNATDANGDSEGNGLTYQPLLGADAEFFAIDPNTGVISFLSAPDFENPLDNDGDNIYQLEVIVEDSTGLSDLQTLSVTVSDVNESKEISIASSQNASEPGVNGEFAVSLTEAAATDTVITYSISGTATPDLDYTALSGTATITAGNLSVPINVSVLDDSEVEGSENVTVTLESISSGDSDLVLSPTNNNATLSITDDDVSTDNEISIASSQNASEPDVNGEFTVSLTEAATTDTVIAYSISGTATPDLDYTALSGTATITAGNLSVPINVSVLDDSEVEGSENVTVTLESISSGDSDLVLSPTNNNATLSLADDDVLTNNEISIASSQNASEPGVNGEFTVSLTEAATTDTVIAYSISGTATPDVDYTTLSGTATITAGNLSVPINVSVLDDSEVEGSENVTVTLESISSGDSDLVLSPTNNNATLSIADDDEPSVLYRINVGGAELASADGSAPVWSEDTNTNPSPHRVGTGGARTSQTSAAIDVSDPSLPPASALESLFQSERWDPGNGEDMQWEFSVAPGSHVEVRLYLAETFKALKNPGERVFDVAVEGVVPNAFDDIDPIATAGYDAFMLSHTVTVTDGILDLDFLHGVENPALKGIEILSSQVLEEFTPIITTANSVTVAENQTAVIDVNATDANGDSEGNGLTYQPLLGADAEFFAIDPNTGVISFLSAPNFENPLDNDGDNIYQLEVIVEDSTGLSDLQTLSVTVEPSVLYRINVGGAELSSADGSDPVWSEDTNTNPSPYRVGTGGANISQTSAAIDVSDASLPPASALESLFQSERWDPANGADMQWEFSVAPGSNVEVRLYLAETFKALKNPGERVFDVAVEGVVPNAFDDIDPIATAGYDAFMLSHTVTVTDGILDLDFLHGVENPALKGIEILSSQVSNENLVGEAVLSINLNSNNVQTSNFGSNSFQLTNTGDKKIAQVEIDVTNALYSDSVFDPFGVAGDTVSKALTLNTKGGTGVVDPNNDQNDPNNQTYIGTGGTAGYKGIRLTFDEAVDGGFQSGETLGFSVDMDPNSVRGTQKSPLDGGSSPSWDVGGVSGAELIGSNFTVTFTDGTTATGQLQGNNNQAGSKGLASQNSPNLSASLTVNGLGAGEVGTYNGDGPSVIVNGPAGETARVVLSKGFIQPVTPYAQFLADQLAGLAATDFPANNAVEFQTVDVLLTGNPQDISSQFDFSGVSDYDFAGESRLPLGFVASIIDPANNDLSLGPVTQPIYLEAELPIVVGLYDADNDTLIANLRDGEQISQSQLTNTNLTIAASVPEDSIFFGQVESISLDLNDGQATLTENAEPYTLFGYSSGDFSGGNIPVGDNSIAFDLYSQDNGQGTLLDNVNIDFSIV